MQAESRPLHLPDLRLFWFLALACSIAALYFGLNEGLNLLRVRQEVGSLPDGWHVVAGTELALIYLSAYAWSALLMVRRPAARVIRKRIRPFWSQSVDWPLEKVKDGLIQLAAASGYLYEELPDGTPVLATLPTMRNPGYFMPVYLWAEGEKTTLELSFWARNHPLQRSLDPRSWLFLASPEGVPTACLADTKLKLRQELEAWLTTPDHG
ncbi:MAG TPA: hypothetical protein V6D23_23985 [Candidatus Obscuribacterales bacterium]